MKDQPRPTLATREMKNLYAISFDVQSITHWLPRQDIAIIHRVTVQSL